MEGNGELDRYLKGKSVCCDLYRDLRDEVEKMSRLKGSSAI